MRTWTRLTLTLLLPLAVGCDNDKDPTVTTAPSSTSEPGTSEPEVTTGEVVTAGDAGDTSDSQASQSDPTSATDPTTDSTTTTDPTVTSDPSASDPSTTTTNNPSDPSTSNSSDPSTTGDPDEGATQLCVDTINMYRATIGVPALARWTDAEVCSDAEAQSDGETNTPHGAFGMCGEGAQNECPGWPAPPETMIENCLAQMWAEGPGDDFPTHGHYINMSNPAYTKVACGFAIVNGEVWAVQNFQ
jgi:hypothetical protein